MMHGQPHIRFRQKDLLIKNNVIKLAATPFTPNLAPANFYLFPLLKSVLKGRHFRDVTDVIENATEKLKIISQNGLQECIQHFYSCWQKRIVPQKDFLEGNVASMIVVFCISQK